MGRKERRKKRNKATQIAKERVFILAGLAKDRATGDVEDHALARRYVEILRRICMRVRKPVPKAISRRICRRCNTYLVPSKTGRFRVSGSGANAHVSVTCLHCNGTKRYYFKRPRAASRDERTGRDLHETGNHATRGQGNGGAREKEGTLEGRAGHP